MCFSNNNLKCKFCKMQIQLNSTKQDPKMFLGLQACTGDGARTTWLCMYSALGWQPPRHWSRSCNCHACLPKWLFPCTDTHLMCLRQQQQVVQLQLGIQVISICRMFCVVCKSSLSNLHELHTSKVWFVGTHRALDDYIMSMHCKGQNSRQCIGLVTCHGRDTTC